MLRSVRAVQSEPEREDGEDLLGALVPRDVPSVDAEQAGPGGFVHVSDDDMMGDGPCGQLGLDGTAMTDPDQRPRAFVQHLQYLVNQTRAANALLPRGAPRHPVTIYVDTYISTGANSSKLLSDSAILDRSGIPQVYTNCSKPGLPPKTQSPMFFARIGNSFSKVMLNYFKLIFELAGGGGQDVGVYHGAMP